MTQRITDFTEGNITKHLINFTIPMLAGNLLQALYNTVDSIWVGRFLGPEALAAVSVSFPIIFALVSLVMGITMATTTLIAQHFGAKNEEMVRKTVNNSITLLFLAAVAISIIGIALRVPILRLVNVPPDVLPQASGYLLVFLSGLVFMFLYNVLSAILRGMGDSRTPLVFLAYATIINIVLDPILIFGLGPIPRLEVQGAALATVIAQGISAYLAVRYLRRTGHMISLHLKDMGIEKDLSVTTLRIGLPAGIQQMVVSLGGLAVTAIINSFGSTVVAAYGAANRLDGFAFMPAMSLGLATSALVGQNLGAGREERVNEIVQASMKLVTALTLPIALIAVLRPQALLILFTADPAVLEVGNGYLRIVGWSYFFLAWMFVFNGVLRGAGDTLPTMFITVASLWLIRVPLAAYLSSLPQLRVTGIWIAVAISPLVGFLLSYVYYLTGRWRRSVVVIRPGDGK